MGIGGQWVGGISVAASSFDLWILFCGGGEPIGVVADGSPSLSRPRVRGVHRAGQEPAAARHGQAPDHVDYQTQPRCVLQLSAVPSRRDAVRASGWSRHEFRVTRKSVLQGHGQLNDRKRPEEPAPKAENGLNSCKRALAEGFHSRVARPGPESFYVRLPC